MDDQSAASQLLCLLQLTLGGGTRDQGGGGEEEADSPDLASLPSFIKSVNSKTPLQKYQRICHKNISVTSQQHHIIISENSKQKASEILLSEQLTTIGVMGSNT